MSGARRVGLVVRREWTQRVRSNAFRISTAVAAAIVVAIIAVPEILGADVNERTVGMVGVSSPQLASVVQATGRQAGLTVSTRRFADEAAGEAALRSGDADVLLVGPGALVWKSDVDEQLGAVVTSAVQAIEQQRAIGELGLTPDQLRTLRPVQVTSRSLEPVIAERSARLDVAIIGLVLLLLAISFYGGFLLVGVIEEKSSRVIEVLLSRLRPTELLAGKIAGIGLVGLAQLSVVAAAGLVALAVSHDHRVPTTTGGTIAWIVVWFVLGYGFYSVLYGAAGSLVSRQEEAQSMTLPITALLLVAYFVALQTVRSPDSTATLVLSFVPPTAPMVMIVRIANGAVPWWQIAISVLLMLATISGMVLLAGRIYTGAVLRLGRRVKLRDAWRGGEVSG
ncbi:MAG TPA: ABC transporter permease [Actinomycetota bacterium]|nr:ABC transporter permease [Actinomycetota bacterium]